MKVKVLSRKKFEEIMKSNGLDDDNIENKPDSIFISIVPNAFVKSRLGRSYYNFE